MRKISSRQNSIIKEAAPIYNWTDVLREIGKGPGRSLKGTDITALLKNPKELASFSTLTDAQKALITKEYPSQVGKYITNGVPTIGTGAMPAPTVGQATAVKPVAPPVAPPVVPPAGAPAGAPTVAPPAGAATVAPPSPAGNTGPLTGNKPLLIGRDRVNKLRNLRNRVGTAPGAINTPTATTPPVVSPNGGAAAAGKAVKFTPGGKATITAALLALLAYPKLNQMIFGGIDRDQLKIGDPADKVRQNLIDQITEYWTPIIDCDVADWDYGGDLSDIADYENTRIIKNYADILLMSIAYPNMRDYALEQITKERIINDLASAQDVSGGSWAARYLVGGRDDRSVDMISKSECVSDGISNFLGFIKGQVDAIKAVDPAIAATTGGNTGGGTGGDTGDAGAGTGGGGTAVPRPTRSEGLDYVGASEIMIEKGFLDSVQTDWTPKFDASFRAFVDTATKNAENIPDSKLVSGQTWGEVAGDIGFTPDARGGIIAVKRLAKFIGATKATGEVPSRTGEEKPAAPKTESTPAVSGKINILAEMIGILYNERLVEGGGILSYEKKQTQSLVDAIGGAGPSGFPNAAKVLLKRNPQLESVVPDKLATPITKKTIKGTELATAFMMVQQTIHDIYESANPGMINPGKNKATENVKKYLGTMAGGSWKEASFSQNRFVKLAEERKERIRREIEANLTPAERAAMRRLRVRGA